MASKKRLQHMLCVMLPWPDTALNPNTKIHWAAKARVVKEYRRVCCYRTYQANPYGYHAIEGKVNIALHFYPPRSGKYDEDNLIARMKAGIDGIAQAIKTDDSNFHLLEPHVHDPCAGGAVVAQLTFLTRRTRGRDRVQT